MENSYSIGDVAKETGVTDTQLRNWDAKGYIPKVNRISAGKRSYRLFSSDDVRFIKKLKSLIDEGYTLQAASKITKADY